MVFIWTILELMFLQMRSVESDKDDLKAKLTDGEDLETLR